MMDEQNRVVAAGRNGGEPSCMGSRLSRRKDEVKCAAGRLERWTATRPYCLDVVFIYPSVPGMNAFQFQQPAGAANSQYLSIPSGACDVEPVYPATGSLGGMRYVYQPMARQEVTVQLVDMAHDFCRTPTGGGSHTPFKPH